MAGWKARRERLREARLQSHYALQWLGRLGGAFVPKQPDYSHTSMDWDDALPGLTTKELTQGLRVGLQIKTLTLVTLSEDERRHPHALAYHSDKDVRRMFGEVLPRYGLDASALDKVAPYEIAAHPIARGGAYDFKAVAEPLAELEEWFAEAHSSLERLCRQKPGASPVRCWPHHFDMASLIALDQAGGEHGRSVNAGFSPGDEHYDEPYYYVSPYPYPAASALPPLRSPLGHWHTRDFTAAIAPATKIVGAENRKAAIAAFLDEAVEAATRLLVN